MRRYRFRVHKKPSTTPVKGKFRPPRPGKRYQYKPPVKQRVDLRGKRIQPYQIQQHVFKDRLHTAELLKRILYAERKGEAGTISVSHMSDREFIKFLSKPQRKVMPVV